MRITELPRPAKKLILILVDAGLASAAYWLASIARFGRVPDLSPQNVIVGTILATTLVPIVAVAIGFYRPVTRFHAPGLPLNAGILSGLCGAILATMALHGGAKPLQAAGFGFVFALVLFALLLASRAAARWILKRPATHAERVAIYGAGEAGRQLAALLARGGTQRPMVFVDDDPKLSGRYVEGLPVINPKAGRFAERLRAMGVREVLVAIPSLQPGRRRELLEFLSELSIRVRSVPRLTELVARGARSVVELVEISVEDLLGRDPVAPLPGLLDSCIRGKTVLVTGGGGSIGSELCRQVLVLQPARLIVVDHSESALYAIEHEIRMRKPGATGLEFVLGSVADRALLQNLFAPRHVDTVYHAAAYKHVPMVEVNPVEGFRNNALGTWHLACAAAQARVGHLVLISTDKAVRPANVMGASKRVAELAVRAVARRSPGTTFVTVRFGNVLGSSGSVVPLFTRQIAAGGPVTLTHPEVTRYFMTIHEAVELVIQAGALARGSSLYVLDMGAPVRIYDLAERMVRLSGRTVRDARNPHGDIAIELVGLRLGEKIHEELLVEGDAVGTQHPRILQIHEKARESAALETDLGHIEELGYDAAALEGVRSVIGQWVPEYAGGGPRGDRAVALRRIS